MVKILLWFILFVLCWPLAVALLLLYPVLWLILIPFRILGVATVGALALIACVFHLPARIMGGGCRCGAQRDERWY